MNHNNVNLQSQRDGSEEEELLSRKLKEAREFLGLSQEAVAEHLGIPRAAVSAIESCKRKVSGLELKKLAGLYRQPYEYFLGTNQDSQSAKSPDDVISTLFRTTKTLSSKDQDQVLKFAQFLRQAGNAPGAEASQNPSKDS